MYVLPPKLLMYILLYLQYASAHFKLILNSGLTFPGENIHLVSETSSPASVNNKHNELASQASLRTLMKMLKSLYG